MTSEEFIEAKGELERLKEEGKYTEVIIPDYEPTERELEFDLLDRKCEAWVNDKMSGAEGDRR